MDMIVLVGISGSGKSTWKTEFLDKNPNYICINRDAIRLGLMGSLNGYYSRRDLGDIEQIVTETVDRIVESANAYDYNLVIDNTNLSAKYINTFINRPCTYRFKLFDISPEIAKYRVIKRENLMPNPDDVDATKALEKVAYIDRQYAQYQDIKKQLLTNYKDNIINE